MRRNMIIEAQVLIEVGYGSSPRERQIPATVFLTPNRWPAPPKVPEPLRSGKPGRARYPATSEVPGWAPEAPFHPANLCPAPTRADRLPRPAPARSISTNPFRLSPAAGETQTRARPISAPPATQNLGRPLRIRRNLGESDQVFTKGSWKREGERATPNLSMIGPAKVRGWCLRARVPIFSGWGLPGLLARKGEAGGR